MKSEKHYAERDIMALDEAGGFYIAHVSAMTSERLHSKSDIAAELAWRDHQIEQLKLQLATETQNSSHQRDMKAKAREQRDAQVAKLEEQRQRITELERDEPIYDDIKKLRIALSKAGIAAPESDETLGLEWLRHVRYLVRSVIKWGFVPASERDALAAQVEVLKSTIAKNCLMEHKGCVMGPDWARDAISSTPTQCLRQINAEAVKELLELGFTPEQYHAFKYSKDGLALQAEAVRDFILWGTLEMDPEFAEFKDSAETYIAQLDDKKAYAERVKAGQE